MRNKYELWGEPILLTESIKSIAMNLLNHDIDNAKVIVQNEYPFIPLERQKRVYTDTQKMRQFVKDGFIDRYTGKKLVNPGILKVISYYLPEEFQYHSHWKMDSCHNAYWEFIPTIDHIHPISLGGADDEENWATTSMLNNSIKSNWTLNQLHWELYPSGDYAEWDGLTDMFITLVEANNELLKDGYIKKWYIISLKYSHQE